jgi:nucleoside phosphorylase
VDQIRDVILRGEDVNLVGGWQTGKTTTLFALRSMGRTLGWASAYVDLAGWGDGLEEHEWYARLHNRILTSLLPPELQELAVSQLRDETSLGSFLVSLVRGARPHQPVVVMFDEVVAVPTALQRAFFAAIRAIQNQRREPAAPRELRAVSFVFAGTFSPDYLIADSHNSPFNISRTINTARHDFSLDQIAELIGIAAARVAPAEIYNWSSGHPYLTNALIEAVKQEEGNTEAAVLELVVHDRHFENLGRSLLVGGGAALRRALRLLREGPVPYVPGFDRDMERLATAGVVKSDSEGNAIIRCKIYERYLARAEALLDNEPTPSREGVSGSLENSFDESSQQGARVRVNVAIVTALPIELDAFLALSDDWEERRISIQPQRTYFMRRTTGGQTVVAVRALAAGPMSAVNLVRDLLAVWQPDNLLLIGIAGGIRGVNLGDVVVSSQLINYEPGKLVGGRLEPRPQVYRSAPELAEKVLTIGRFRRLEKISVPRPDGRAESSRVVIGDVLSGSKVIADNEAVQQLTASWTSVRAVEMEASAVAATLAEMPSPPKFLMIKGICDKADAEKCDDWQQYACAVAAAVATELIDALRS